MDDSIFAMKILDELKTMYMHVTDPTADHHHQAQEERVLRDAIAGLDPEWMREYSRELDEAKADVELED